MCIGRLELFEAAFCFIFTQFFAMITTMELFRKHMWVWKVIIVIASLALVATSILPFIVQ